MNEFHYNNTQLGDTTVINLTSKSGSEVVTAIGLFDGAMVTVFVNTFIEGEETSKVLGTYTENFKEVFNIGVGVSLEVILSNASQQTDIYLNARRIK